MEVWWVAAARAAPVLAVTARWTVEKSQGPGCGGSGRCSRRRTTTARRQPSGAPPSCGTGWGPAYLPDACPHRSCWSCSSSCRRPWCTLTRLASWRSLSNRAASAEPDKNYREGSSEAVPFAWGRAQNGTCTGLAPGCSGVQMIAPIGACRPRCAVCLREHSALIAGGEGAEVDVIASADLNDTESALPLSFIPSVKVWFPKGTEKFVPLCPFCAP